jgi:cytochrome c-type biogenesis protein CcmE
MTDATWEKNPATVRAARTHVRSRFIYLLIGLGLLVAVAYLLVTGTLGGRYYITVDELVLSPDNIGKDVRVAGAVDGETIRFDQETNTLHFTVVNIPNDNETIREAGGLGEVLHTALTDPAATRMEVVWPTGEMPELLQHEAQAIMNGQLDENGVFQANEVLLKCPTRYSDDVPEQVVTQ